MKIFAIRNEGERSVIEYRGAESAEQALTDYCNTLILSKLAQRIVVKELTDFEAARQVHNEAEQSLLELSKLKGGGAIPRGQLFTGNYFSG